uniref:Uncharacterized protein n=1 Tax=Moniliophthora roreri TaxID=221103 RepID=A0A0W0FA98_MONRR
MDRIILSDLGGSSQVFQSFRDLISNISEMDT